MIKSKITPLSSNFKLRIWRNEEYLKWVKRQPSCISGRPSDDPHHIEGYTWLFRGVGGTIKEPDWAVIPLTRDEHTDIEQMGVASWEAVHGSQLWHLVRTLDRAFAEGVLDIGVFRE